MDESRRRSGAVESVLTRTIALALPNGLTLLLSPDASEGGVCVTLAVKAGYFDEAPHLAGVSHLLEHLICHRANDVERASRPSRPFVISASTIYNHTTYTATTDTADLAAALEALSHAYTPSEVDGDSFEREQRVILHEAARKSDSSGASIVEELYGQLFRDHPLALHRHIYANAGGW